MRKSLFALLFVVGLSIIGVAAYQSGATITVDCGSLVPVLYPQTANRALVRCEQGGVVPTPTPLPTATPTPVPTPTPTPIPVNAIYVAPNGTPSGNGTINNPIDIVTAFAVASPARPGSLILLRGGTYADPGWVRTGNDAPPNANQLVCYLQGSVSAPITIKSAPGEWAVIDPSLKIEGLAQWLIIRDLEIVNSGQPRTTPRPTGVNVFGKNVKLINLAVHEAGNGIAGWSQAENLIVEGCLIYHNGWDNPNESRGHGHNIYTQNETGQKVFRDNIIWESYDAGVHAYGEQGFADNIKFEGNIIFESGAPSVPRDPTTRFDNLLIGTTTHPPTHIEVVSNYLFHSLSTIGTNFRMGYGPGGNNDLSFALNYCASGKSMGGGFTNWRDAFVQGNTFINNGANDVLINVIIPTVVGSYNWNNNSYASGFANPFGIRINNVGANDNFAQWKAATGFDGGSAFSTIAGLTGARVFVRPNSNEQGRAHAAVFNWSGSTAVDVNLAGVLTSGQQFDVWNVRDLSVPVASGTYNGALVSLPITGNFGAYLVKRR